MTRGALLEPPPQRRTKRVFASTVAEELAARAADRVGRSGAGVRGTPLPRSHAMPSGLTFVEWLEAHGF